MSLAINTELPLLNAEAMVVLYVLDATAQGGGVFRFYPSSKDGSSEANVLFQGQTFIPFPVDFKGMELKGEGAPPRPSVIFSNVTRLFSSLALAYDDLIGARVIRRRTFAKFLDGAAEANPLALFPDDIFFIERKVAEARTHVEFELGTPMDLDDVTLPRRTIHANLCVWRYRGGECGHVGESAFFDSDDVECGETLTNPGAVDPWDELTTYSPGDIVYMISSLNIRSYFVCTATASGENAKPPNTAYWFADVCSKRQKGCVLRFGNGPEGLPYGGFPATTRIV